jgi:predicted PurR-regulated permease PerM
VLARVARPALIIFFVGVFGAAEPGLYRAGLLRLVPPPQRPRAEEAVDTLTFNLRWWLVGQVVLMLVMAGTTALGLWLVGVPLALTLGLLAGALELVPYVGPWASAVPAVLVALTVSPTHLLLTVALYLALHLLEGYVLLPLVQRRAVHLPPALTVAAQALLGELLGVMGLFVAAPLTLCAVVLLKMLYVEDTLGDESVDVPGEPGNEEKQLAAQAEGWPGTPPGEGVTGAGLAR